MVLINLIIISIYVLYVAGLKRDSVYQKIDSTLLAAAAASKPNLSIYHNKTASAAPTDEEYKTLLLGLGDVAKTIGVEFIYSVIEKDGKFYFTSDSATDEDFATDDISHYMSEYEDVSPKMAEAFSTSAISLPFSDF